MRFFNNIVLLLACLPALAQSQKQDSVHVLRKFVPTGIRLGIDGMAYTRAQVSKTFTGFEANVEVDFYRYYPTFEIGQSARDFASQSGSSYTNDGRFWRIGIDADVINKNAENALFFLGGRFGRAIYSENATLVSTDKLWGDFRKSYLNDGLTANWFELTSGLRVRLWKVVWLGYTGRFKFGLNVQREELLLTTDVPGYGSTDRPTTWGFNYYLLVKVPMRKAR